MQILNLIIASDNEIYYKYFVRQWRRYMHLHPKIDSYFVWMREVDGSRTTVMTDPNDERSIIVDGDEEAGVPAIFQKTLRAMAYAFNEKEKDGKHYDYVLRTNLSSFFIWDRLVECLETQGKTSNLMMGHANPYPIAYPSGCGFVMSVDVARLCMEQHLHDPNQERMADDCMFGWICREHNIPIVHSSFHSFPGEVSVNGLQLFRETFIQTIPSNVYHVRVRSGREWYRERIEPLLYARLIDHFYLSSYSSSA